MIIPIPTTTEHYISADFGFRPKSAEFTEMLLIRHALLAAEQMKTEGDSISGMTDPEPSSFYVKR